MIASTSCVYTKFPELPKVSSCTKVLIPNEVPANMQLIVENSKNKSDKAGSEFLRYYLQLRKDINYSIEHGECIMYIRKY